MEHFYNLTKKLISAAKNLCAKSKSETVMELNQAIVEMKFLAQNWHNLSDQQFAKYIEKVDEIRRLIFETDHKIAEDRNLNWSILGERASLQGRLKLDDIPKTSQPSQ